MQAEAVESNRVRLAATQRGHLQRIISTSGRIIVRLLTNQIGEFISHLNSQFTRAASNGRLNMGRFCKSQSVF
jgi:hypothetical protein